MLPPKNRLIKNNDFYRLAKTGKASFSKEMILKSVKNNLPYSRFGIIVSLKVDKKSTVRNKIKRKIREILRLNLSFTLPGYDFMILTKDKIKELNYHQIEKKIFELLNNFLVKSDKK